MGVGGRGGDRGQGWRDRDGGGGTGMGVGAGVGVVVCTYLPHCVCVAAGCEEERPKHSVQCGNDILPQEVSVHVNVW